MPTIDAEKVVWNDVDGSVIVLQFASGAYFALNDVGSTIWKLMSQGKTAHEIARVLKGKYDIPIEELERDVQEFFSQAIAKGLANA